MASYGNFWKLLEIIGNFWQLSVAVCGSMWQSVAVKCQFQFLQIDDKYRPERRRRKGRLRKGRLRTPHDPSIESLEFL